ncbi:hypothetical protein AGABI2DRAFT_115762 [Agaricus bisporus var. bisporus H97]|uniref:hypothetical protein n=1 Tax=Agaricus bisporus var. bisporus (strain H97 / ATCC MYA-4626 / FGSC 10389) TaxID=936046 RepID=UPI00029F7E60|nr:hypothetical protein AGABI2DRAFT_115762 [Agaricus bisporus var. bisporus H97]EKV50700.1 hypothetical protein AGABI2DRAFT_115762 [Agaricus bisporus var. bisporus H97]
MHASSNESLHQCDYLRPHSTAYGSNLAELVHLNEQIGSLDNHIHRLTELRHTLRSRANQLQNLCSPAYALPTEVLSHIFCQMVDPGVDSLEASAEVYKKCIRQSLVLSSVSARFRRVAFGTSELWKRVLLDITDEAVDCLVSMLQHCVTHAPYLDIIIYAGGSDIGELSTYYSSLFLPEIVCKVKAFQLLHYDDFEIWIEKLSSFPILDTLVITQSYPEMDTGSNFNLGALTSVTRLGLHCIHLYKPFTLPPSVQVLLTVNVPQHVLVSFLHRCPNLVECSTILPAMAIGDEEEFAAPAVLNYIKRLSWDIEYPSCIEFIQNIHMPSLEVLELEHHHYTKFELVHLLCCNVSMSLTTLILTTWASNFDQDDLHRFFRLPFPRLHTLEFCRRDTETDILDIIQGLRPDYEVGRDLKNPYLPSLRSLTLGYAMGEDLFRSLLALLQEWRIGETSYFHIKVASTDVFTDQACAPQLQKELISVVGNRQIGMTWGSEKLC